MQTRVLYRLQFFPHDLKHTVIAQIGGLTLLIWVILRIYIASTIFQSYPKMEAGDTLSLKFKKQDRELNSRPPALQAKSFTTLPLPLPIDLKSR